MWEKALSVHDSLDGPALHQFHCPESYHWYQWEEHVILKFSFNMQSRSTSPFWYFFPVFCLFFFNTTWFYCIYSLFLHARSWPCSTVSHMWLNAPQVKALPQKSVLKNDPTLQSLASEVVELYRHDTWSVYCFTDVTWKYSFQDAPNSPVFLDSPTFQLWIT